ncbi:MAG: carboxypeptidase-like regulatory domain-containing protein [Ferruginibacter sp.]
MKQHILFVILLTAYTAAFSQNCAIGLSGHVTDSDTRQKLVNATVSLVETGKTIITNEEGDFVFSDLCAGNYTLKITHVNCDTLLRKIVLSKQLHIDVSLPHAVNTLGEVTVTSLKGIQNTGIKKELSGKELEETRGLSLAEALSKMNGVALLQTGATISKPVIHGLHSNRILTINNGVRQEGQQWGNEHAPEVDPFIADNLVVIKGVDELRYGSDAIGGVILVNPKPLRHQPGYYGELNTAYFTNNGEYVFSGMFEQQLKKQPAFSYRLQGTFKQGGNVSTPGYRLNNTGIKEQNFSLTTGWNKKNYNIEAFYSQFRTTVGIFSGSHIGNLTDLRTAIDASQPADIFLGDKTYSIKRPNQDVIHRLFKVKSSFYSGGSKFNVLLAAQYNHRKEYDVQRSSSSNKSAQLNLSILTLSEDVSWDHPKVNNLQGTVAVSSMQQDNSYSGRYFIPNYFATIYGGYWIEKWAKHRWELQGGIRYDFKNIATKRLLFNGAPINNDFNYSTLASSFNTLYKINDDFRVNAGITLANRAPYVNELLSDGIHHGTATYESGDINLKTERSVNIAASLNYSNKAKTFFADITIYNNSINNFIYQQPKPDSPVLTIAGAFPLLKYQQTNALLRGTDITLSYYFFQHLELTSKVSILRAYNRSIDDWLILMPSDRLSNELAYKFKDKGKLTGSYMSAEVATVFKQTRVPSDKYGKQDYKAPPAGYTLLNLNASTTINFSKLPVTFSLGARNILNKRYREYLNSFRYFTDEMGRNISIRVKVPFEKLLH